MSNSDPGLLAADISVAAAKLVRWLRLADPAPSFGPAEAAVMGAIMHSGGISPAMLAYLEQVSRPTISRILTALVDRGMIERKPRENDGRGYLVVATQKGSATWYTGQARRIAPLADRIAKLSDGDLERLTDALPLILELVAPPQFDPAIEA